MSSTVPTLVNPPATAQPGDRTATASIQGVALSVPCPQWCAIDHADQDVRFFEDLYHSSAPIAVSAPTGIKGSTEDVVQAYITHYPFARGARPPHIELDAAGDGEGAELTSVEALAFADQLAAHAAALRTLAGVLADAEAGA